MTFLKPLFLTNFFMTPFFTYFVLSHASDNIRPTSREIGGTDAWAVPPPRVLGEDRPPSPPVSLRPWGLALTVKEQPVAESYISNTHCSLPILNKPTIFGKSATLSLARTLSTYNNYTTHAKHTTHTSDHPNSKKCYHHRTHLITHNKRLNPVNIKF